MRKYFEDPELRMYLNDIGSCKILSAEEEIALASKFKNGDESAFLPLFRSQLKFVVKISKRYKSYDGHVSFMDLIQVGNIGLIRAIEKFKPSKKVRLSNFAKWWIDREIWRFFAGNLMLSGIPLYIFEHSLKFKKFRTKLGRDPSTQEFADYIKCTLVTSEKTRIVANLQRKTITLKSAFRLYKVMESKKMTLEDIFFRRHICENVVRLLTRMFHNLEERDLMIVKMKLDPFSCEKEMNPRQIGEKCGVSGERVRQIVKKFKKDKAEELKQLKELLIS